MTPALLAQAAPVTDAVGRVIEHGFAGAVAVLAGLFALMLYRDGRARDDRRVAEARDAAAQAHVLAKECVAAIAQQTAAVDRLADQLDELKSLIERLVDRRPGGSRG